MNSRPAGTGGGRPATPDPKGAELIEDADQVPLCLGLGPRAQQPHSDCSRRSERTAACWSHFALAEAPDLEAGEVLVFRNFHPLKSLGPLGSDLRFDPKVAVCLPYSHIVVGNDLFRARRMRAVARSSTALVLGSGV